VPPYGRALAGFLLKKRGEVPFEPAEGNKSHDDSLLGLEAVVRMREKEGGGGTCQEKVDVFREDGKSGLVRDYFSGGGGGVVGVIPTRNEGLFEGGSISCTSSVSL